METMRIEDADMEAMRIEDADMRPLHRYMQALGP
jgi:hypothetical protein